MNWLKENWTNIFLFLWASAWTAGGIYFAVDVVLENQRITTWSQVLELFVFLNFAAFVVYSGLKTQFKIFNEWREK
ncbi:MAG: hypothetical protein A2940_01775 [Candidatus Wildermuthbacteria bacterium RIFCSPLOWO2_01_FULL_48_29]|uniref:Uncharacterized protein n=1 Tax=Candidatus Wildermuthbacteria bacterium RIFCSPLOWO2_01_FULL_48_29 TaxID=1802462 RepID=A0A1G2RLF8_9BACT|nr:MAG: hypothetical protein A2940_01775 [Candidatus Wildermuthbacteria bacterium RIFCSPLOWO2_01_FULL_48_29]